MILFLIHVLSFKGNHTIAVVEGSEDYETLKNGLKNVCETVSQLVERGHMIIDGKKVNLHFHFGGDNKLSGVSEIHVIVLSST